MQKYFYYFFLLSALFFSSTAHPAQAQEPESLPTFSEGRRFLTPKEVQDFVYRGQRPAGLDNVGHIFSMAWTDIERALNHALTDIRDNGYQNLNKINEVLGIEKCYRSLRAKDRNLERVRNLDQIERNIARARAAITTTLESRVRSSFLRLVSSSDAENRQQAFMSIFEINAKFSRLSPELLPAAGSYFHNVIAGLSSTPPDTFKGNPLLILPIEEDFSLRDFREITDPICLTAVRQLRSKLRIKYHRDYLIQERSFLRDCCNGEQRLIAATAMVEFSRRIVRLHELLAIPVQGLYLTARNNATFYKLLADNNLLTPSEIRQLGSSSNLAARVLASVRTFSSTLAEGITGGTATKPDLEVAIGYCQALASVIKSDHFPQQEKVNSLRRLAIEIDGVALAHIANQDRTTLRRLDAIRLSWAQQVLNWDEQTPELYKQAYTILEAVRESHFVRSRATPLVLAALIIKRGVLPDGCGNSDDATVIASALYGEYESTHRDKKEPAEKRKRDQPTPTKEACPYRTAATLHDLAKLIELRLAALTPEEDFSDYDGEEIDAVPDVVRVGAGAGAAAAALAAVADSPDRGRLSRKRPIPLDTDLDTDEEDVVTAAAAAPGSFPSPESARSRAGQGAGSHHVAPLDEQRKQIIRELYDRFKRTNPTNYLQALTAYLNEKANVTKHGLPQRDEKVTKSQIYRLMSPRAQSTP